MHIHLTTSRYLGDQMDEAMAYAGRQRWQEGSAIAFIRNRMERAYQVAMAIEAAIKGQNNAANGSV